MSTVLSAAMPAEVIQKVFDRAQTDGAFRRALKGNPREVLSAAGYDFPADKPVQVVDPDDVYVLVLPPTMPPTFLVNGLAAIDPARRAQLQSEAPAGGVCQMHSYWWGQSLELSEDYMHYLWGIKDAGETAAAIAIAVGGPAAEAIGIIFGIYLLAEGAAIEFADQGNGVFLNQSWTQWVIGIGGVIIPTAR